MRSVRAFALILLFSCQTIHAEMLAHRHDTHLLNVHAKDDEAPNIPRLQRRSPSGGPWKPLDEVIEEFARQLPESEPDIELDSWPNSRLDNKRRATSPTASPAAGPGSISSPAVGPTTDPNSRANPTEAVAKPRTRLANPTEAGANSRTQTTWDLAPRNRPRNKQSSPASRAPSHHPSAAVPA